MATRITEIGTAVEAEHGIISSLPEDVFGYFGWPTVARLGDGRLAVTASGYRTAHVCPFGRTVISFSNDDGGSWTVPRVINDSPLDDRDAGVVALGGDGLLVSWFSSDTRISPTVADMDEWEDQDRATLYRNGMAGISDESAARWSGFWIRTSGDGGETWRDPVRVALTTPHGPVRTRSGDLLYFGKGDPDDMFLDERWDTPIAAMGSRDGGSTWEKLGLVPLPPEIRDRNCYEPHVAEMPDGMLVGMIRIQDYAEEHSLEEAGIVSFSLAQTVSKDGGRTWSPAEPLGFHGSPPHLLVHSTGALVCVYGHRLEPYGERAMISRDGGESWECNYVLRDDGPDRDLGYPSSVELSDGSILTVYYQKLESPDEKCSLLWTRWRLPSAGNP